MTGDIRWNEPPGSVRSIIEAVRLGTHNQFYSPELYLENSPELYFENSPELYLENSPELYMETAL